MSSRSFITALALVTVGWSTLEAQTRGPQAAAPATAADRAVVDSFVVVPGPTYGKSGLWTVFAGEHYRHLWTTPIRVPVLDCQRFAGGLQPIEEHSGSQTKSLRLRG